MIFIAKNADFSANNIGQIDVKSISDIAPSTVSLLSFFGKDWSDSQKIKIDNFFENFQAATWKSKVKLMIMPILMPAQNSIVQSAIIAGGSKFRRNLVDSSDVTPQAPLADPTYGYVGISTNGAVLQVGNASAFHANLSLGYNVSNLGVTNKDAHYGVYFKDNTIFRAGSASTTEGVVVANSTGVSSNFFQSFQANNTNVPAPHRQLLLLNGNATGNIGKSYVNGSLVNTTIVGTTASTIQTKASIITGGTGQNIANESTCSFMTFGTSLSDAEITEYAGMINTLMNALYA